MNQNAELLNYVYQNSQMGVETLNQLVDICEDNEFVRHMQSQLNEYREIFNTAKQMLNQNGFDEKGISAMSKVKTYMMINMQTLTDKTPSHIAQMLMVGSNMGIIDAVKNLKKYKEAESDIIQLCEKLLHIEENNIQQLKNFL